MELISKARGSWMRLGAAVLVVAAVAAALRLGLADRLEPKAALELLRSVQNEWWAEPAYFAAYLAGTSFFLPAVLFHMVAGAAWGFWKGAALNFAAVNLVANLQFHLGRRLGRERVARLLARYRLVAFDEQAVRHGFRAMVVIRMLPLPFVGVNVAAGVSAMKAWHFFFGSMAGSFPVMVVYTYFAASLVEGVAGAERRALVQALVAGVVVVLLTFVPRLAARFSRGR